MNTTEATTLICQRLDIYRSQRLAGLLLPLVAVVLFLADFLLETFALISSNWAAILLLIALLIFCLGLYLCRNVVPAYLALRRCLKKLEERDLLETAAAALNAPEEGLLGGQCHLAGGYLFAPEKGVILPVSELGWIYFHHMGNRRLDLVAEVNTWGTRYFSLLSLSDKASTTEVNELLQQAESLFPEALIGYSKETKAAWKALCAQRKQGH